MATDSLAGLFGSPLSQQQLQNQLIEQRAAQMADMNLGQMGAFLGYKGGAQLGQGIGSLFGQDVTDPTVRRATQLRQLAQGIDVQTTAGLEEYAKRLQANGFTEEAARLGQQIVARKKEESIAEKNLRSREGATTVSERNRSVIRQAEVKLAGGEALTPQEEAQVRWLVAQETKPKIFRDSDTGEIVTVEPIDIGTAAPNIAKMLGMGGAKPKEGAAPTEGAPAAGVKVTTTPQTKLPASIKKEVATTEEQISVIDSSITKINKLIPDINSLDLGLLQNIERAGRAFIGRPTADTKKFNELKRAVLEQANNLLLLAKGTQTEGDAQRARDQIADDNTWKNRDLLTGAMDDLVNTLGNTKKALQAKKTTLVSPGIPGIGEGDVAPRPSPFSGANPNLQPAPEAPAPAQPRATHRFNPATGRVEKL